jgi:hypothetical protein
LSQRDKLMVPGALVVESHGDRECLACLLSPRIASVGAEVHG